MKTRNLSLIFKLIKPFISSPLYREETGYSTLTIVEIFHGASCLGHSGIRLLHRGRTFFLGMSLPKIKWQLRGIWVWMKLKGLLGAVAQAPWLPVTEPLAACVSLVDCRRCVGSLLGLLCLWLRTCDYADRFWQPKRQRKDRWPGKGKAEKRKTSR